MSSLRADVFGATKPRVFQIDTHAQEEHVYEGKESIRHENV